MNSACREVNLGKKGRKERLFVAVVVLGLGTGVYFCGCRDQQVLGFLKICLCVAVDISVAIILSSPSYFKYDVSC